MGMMMMLAPRSNGPSNTVNESRHGPAHENGTMPHPHMQPQQSYPANAAAYNAQAMQMAAPQMLVPGLPSLAQNNSMPTQARAMGFLAPPQDYEGYGGYAESYEPEARRRRSRRTGRWYRAAADPDMEMRMHGGGGSGEDDEEMGMAESKPKGGGALKTIRKMLKGLENKIEDLQEALEEHAEKKEKGKKKKKPKPDEDDGDEDDDDPAQEADRLEEIRGAMNSLAENRDFMAALPDALGAMLAVLTSPPDTWNSYLEKGDLAAIVGMEEKELTKAITAYRLKQRKASDVYKEITHTGAALLLLFAALLHSEQDKAQQ